MTQRSHGPSTERNSDAVPASVFVGLYEEYMPRLFRYFSYRVGNTGLAEDLTSTVFEKALSRLGSYRTERASLPTWLMSIARNTLIDHYRVNSPKKTLPIDEAAEVASPAASPEEVYIKKEEQQRLQGFIAELSGREQEILSLKFGAEMTNREISDLVGLSESNVGTILYRAVGKLRDRFRE